MKFCERNRQLSRSEKEVESRICLIDYFMDRFHTVKKSKDFSEVIHKGRFVKNRSFVIYSRDNGLPHYRFGISVSKKLGNAVHRNLYKRQLRFLIDKYKKYYQSGVDYIIIIRNSFISLSFEEKDKDYLYLIEKMKKETKKEIMNEEKK